MERGRQIGEVHDGGLSNSLGGRFNRVKKKGQSDKGRENRGNLRKSEGRLMNLLKRRISKATHGAKVRFEKKKREEKRFPISRLREDSKGGLPCADDSTSQKSQGKESRGGGGVWVKKVGQLQIA